MGLSRPVSERGDIILRHVIMILLIVVLIVFVISEAGPIVWYRVSTIQDAEDVANAAAFNYKLHRNEHAARVEAGEKMRLMGYSDEEITQSALEFLPPGSDEKREVRVTVVRYARTLLTRNVSQLKKFSRVATTREANVATATSSSNY